MAPNKNIIICTLVLLGSFIFVNAMPGNVYPKKVILQGGPSYADFLVNEDDSQFQPRFEYQPRYESEGDSLDKKPMAPTKFKRAAAYSSSGGGAYAGPNAAGPFASNFGFNPYNNFAYPFDFNGFFSNIFRNIPQYSTNFGNAGAAAASGAYGGNNFIGTGLQNNPAFDLQTRFGSFGSGPGVNGVFSSSHSGYSNVNGKVNSFREATTGVSKDGKVTYYTVRDP